jgi:toxin ParE1/3/4
MVLVVWSKNAKFDLKYIHSYISYDSERYAKKVVQGILLRTKKLESSPNLGRIIPEINNTNYKELIIGTYRIMFKIISETEVLILAVFHSSREFDIEKIEPIDFPF